LTLAPPPPPPPPSLQVTWVPAQPGEKEHMHIKLRIELPEGYKPPRRSSTSEKA
jgi:hypothetical protein